MSPHTGETVGLQFERDRSAAGSRPAITHRAGIQSRQVLYVMTDFVRDDVRLREVAGRAKSLRELVEKPKVEIDLSIPRAIERPGGRLSVAARRLHGVPEQGDRCALIARAEFLGPHVLGIL